jgi:hypothetical protein
VRSAISNRRLPPDKWLGEALLAIQSASAAITDRQLENPARRALRDLDAASGLLTACTQPLLRVEGLSLNAPDKVAPGDTVPAMAQVCAPEGIVRRADISLWADGKRVAGRRVAIPADAKAGSVIGLRAEAVVELAAGGRFPLCATRSITVTPPFNAELGLDSISSVDDSQTIALQLVNNLSRPQRFAVAVKAAAGWAVKEFNQRQTVAPWSRAAPKLTLAPSAAVKPGLYDVVVTVQGEGKPQTSHLEISHVPASANKLKNPGFESSDGKRASNWGPWEGGYALDAGASRSGRRSLRLQTDNGFAHMGASQGIPLNQTKITPLIVRGWCKTDKLTGSHTGCCLYVDFYYVDGSKLYGQKVVFDGGTHDWQLRETRIQTTKPIRSASFYVMLQGAVGTAWFDDVLLAEDLPGGGNRIPANK